MWTEKEIGHYLELTLAVYRVTELFPKKEPLRSQIRESANKVLADLLLNQDENGGFGHAMSIEEMMGFLDLAEAKNWVDSRNFFVIRREYDRIEQSITSRALKIKQEKEKTVENEIHLIKTKERQTRILGIFRESGKVKVGHLTRFFPEVNRRTLLRDLENFVQLGLVERNGNGRAACYVAKKCDIEM